MEKAVIQQIKEHPEVYRELMGVVCACGGRKGSSKSFCWKCWCSLTASIKRRLSERVGYPEAVADAKSQLRAKGRFV